MYSQSVVPIAQPRTAPKTLLYDLDINCKLDIFRNLSLEDLAKVTEVCKHFRDVAADVFEYKWKNETIRLSNECSNSRLESAAILRNFGVQLRNVQIDFSKSGNDTFFELIMDKCSSQLKHVSFSCTCFDMELEKVLSKENMQRFNAKFENMVTLKLDNNIDDLSEPDCIEQHFPALEELSLSGYPFGNRNIRQFVKLNPQIKGLFSFHCNNVRDAVKMIRIFDKHLPRLEKLGLWIHGQAEVIRFQPRFLKALKYLKIRNYGNTANLQHLSIFNETVEEMELDLGSCNENLIDFVCQYKELTKLVIRFYCDSPVDFKFLPELKRHLPKLTELEVSGYWKDLNHTEIVYFVHGSKLLVKLVLRSGKWKDILEDMDKVKEKLNSAIWTVKYIAPPRQLHFVRVKRPKN